ncbi:DHH family phosphoesterase [Candidatus Woesearchaeota archaeon]|nr:DHH family phosphoesterase [Candidatus Woesearchaeota archaeon]
MSSGIILSRLVQSTTGKKPELYPTSYSDVQKETITKLIRKNKLEKVIIVDIAIDEQKIRTEKISKETSWFLVDHHELYNDSKNVIKPQKFSDIPASSYPCGKIAYDLASQKIDVTKLDWVACLGIIGDFGIQQWKTFLEETYKKYRWETKEKYFETILGDVCKLITSIEATNDIKKIKKLSLIIEDAESPQEVLKSPLKKIQEAVEKEINREVATAEKNTKNNYIYAEVKSKYNIKGPVSTILGVKNPNKTIVTASYEDKFYNISSRRQDGKYSVSELINSLTRKIPGAMGGGHPNAAGGSVPEKYYEKFKKDIIKILETHE